VFTTLWLLLSSLSLSQLANMRPFLPTFIVQWSSQWQTLHLHSGYGLFRRMTGVGEHPKASKSILKQSKALSVRLPRSFFYHSDEFNMLIQ
jgi:hypothetical protein